MGSMTREQFNQNEQMPTDFLSIDQRTHLAGLDKNRYTRDAVLHVRFFMKATPNQLRTELEGRAIYDDLEYIEIWIPGDKTNINVRPVQLDDKDRFKAQYAAWKLDQKQITGTPLSLLPFIAESQVAELAYFRIVTAEQLAGVADNLIGNMAGLTLLKQQAAEWLAKQEGSGELLKRIAALEAMVEASRPVVREADDTPQSRAKRTPGTEKAPSGILA